MAQKFLSVIITCCFLSVCLHLPPFCCHNVLSGCLCLPLSPCLPLSQPEKTGEDVEPAGDEDSESDSDDDDDDVRVTIGDIKTGAPQYTYVPDDMLDSTGYYAWLV